MDPKEIKIGNLLNHEKYGLIEVLGIIPHCDDYKIETIFGWVYLKNCEPILITNNVLKRIDADTPIQLYINGGIVIFGNWYRHIIHVHNLQNLWFVLCGYELKVKGL